MGFFFKAVKDLDARVEPQRTAAISTALDDLLARSDRSDPQVRASAIELRNHFAAAAEEVPTKYVADWRIVAPSFALLILIFWLAYEFEGSATHPKASDNLFTAFQVLFTAFLAAFGLENVKTATKN
jgi:hypothetical protein